MCGKPVHLEPALQAEIARACFPLAKTNQVVMSVVGKHLQMSSHILNLLGQIRHDLWFDSLFLYPGFLLSLTVVSTGYCHSEWARWR